MSYQSNPEHRVAEESYDSPFAITGRLLPDSGGGGINVGAPNSARGGGTTAAELVAKFRFLNVCACLFVLLFHTAPIAFHPIRLTLLLSSPVRLVLELVVGSLALFLLLVEARIPILGEGALNLARRFPSGCIDLDAARGRVLALAIVGGSLGLIDYLSRGGVSRGGGGADPPGDPSIPPGNATDSGSGDAGTTGKAAASALSVIIQCTVFSPTVLVVSSLLAYTIYVMNAFPEYAQSTAYSTEDAHHATSAAPASPDVRGPSWVSNVGQIVQGSGYQNVNAY